MQSLVEGVHFFQNVGFPQQRELFARLAQGQKPEACFITCSDSRIDPNLITNARPGQLFIVRNVGNVVPCHGTSNNGELAAVEYAVRVLGIRDIIVCGHTHCGAMRGVLGIDNFDAISPVKDWLRHADATLAIIREHYTHLHGPDLVTATAEENVLVQLEHLRTFPIVAAGLIKGRLAVHGWMYKIETGEIFVYDAEQRQFAKLGSERDGTAQSAETTARSSTSVSADKANSSCRSAGKARR
jgi:carbonic anhydrase